MHSAFNLFVFPNYMFTSLLFLFLFFIIFYERAMSSPEKKHLKITIIIIIIICAWFGLVIALLMVFLKNALMCI